MQITQQRLKEGYEVQVCMISGCQFADIFCVYYEQIVLQQYEIQDQQYNIYQQLLTIASHLPSQLYNIDKCKHHKQGLMDNNLETVRNYVEEFFKEDKNNEKEQQMLFRIQYGNIQKLSPAIQNLLQQKLTRIKTFCITNCRLHTLQNFPLLPSLLYLDISNNMLIGSFQFIVKNRTIKYIDISFNYISHIQKLQFLRVFKSIQIYAHNNPFCKDLSRKQETELKKKLKKIHVDLISLPRRLWKQSPVQKQRKMLNNQKEREESKKNIEQQQQKQKDKFNQLKVQLQEIKLGLIERMTYMLLNREVDRFQVSQIKQMCNFSDQQIKEAASRIIEKSKIRSGGKPQMSYQMNVSKNKDESEDEDQDDSSSEEREQAKFSGEQENSISEYENESSQREESEEVKGKKTQSKK